MENPVVVYVETNEMKWGALTAEYYLEKAVRAIDRNLGDGYAKLHPELIAAFMRVAADDERFATEKRLAV